MKIKVIFIVVGVLVFYYCHNDRSGGCGDKYTSADQHKKVFHYIIPFVFLRTLRNITKQHPAVLVAAVITAYVISSDF